LEPLLDLRVPRPLAALPENRRGLRQQRRRIDASAGLEVLWHERWRQPIPSEDQSVPLLIESEQVSGDFPELQGSILLYSGRFLHIVADLWLNTDGSYLDNERATTGWHMPPPPLPPQDRTTELPDFRVDPGPDFLMASPAPVSAEGDTPADSDRPPAAVAVAIATSDVPAAPGEDPDAAARSEMMSAFLAGPQVDYPWRHAVLLQQRRRMRSGELHYIDHPLLGIVVRISPLEFPPFVSPAGRPLPPDTP
ncbi:MAG: CsiV family protein, partial [Halieaceae bacterium]|nr:CsiV family protein [Halieaceae bacterium]